MSLISFSPSTRFQAWMTGLRVSWMGPKGRAVMGAFAKIAGDLVYDWMQQALLERFPEYATSFQSVKLTASERQLVAGPSETQAQLATRATQGVNAGKMFGGPLGMLLALHFAGFDNAVIVTQNGLGYQLTLPLPAMVSGGAWQPITNLAANNLSALANTMNAGICVTQSNILLAPTRGVVAQIPAAQPWWAFDPDTDFCSRFAVLFPGPFPKYFTTWARAVFNGSTDTVTVTWNNPFADTNYNIASYGVTVTDGGGPVTAFADGTTKAQAGVNIVASAPFTGFVDVLAVQSGSTNPYADLHPNDLNRLQQCVSLFKPKKATCNGVYVLTQGKFSGWPVSTAGNMLGKVSTVAQIPGSGGW